jgi:non-heme chloroperoxidase
MAPLDKPFPKSGAPYLDSEMWAFSKRSAPTCKNRVRIVSEKRRASQRIFMSNFVSVFIIAAALSACVASAQQPADTSTHTVQLISVAQDVRLEVVDWGGTGRPVVFLAGAGNTAHAFDTFAPKFTSSYHVYGITRRGFGASSKPAPANDNYSANQLGDDILAVLDTLRLERPVLVGHSFAGEEMSSIGSRHPQRVSGLIYLEAAYGFAFYDPAHPMMEIEMNDLKRRIEEIEAGGVDEQKKLIELESALSQFQNTLHKNLIGIASMPPLPPRPPIQAALNFGVRRFTTIPVPVLAIFACPHNWDRAFQNDPAMKAQRLVADTASCSAQADAFAKGVPTAQVIRIPNADHYVFNSNEPEVLNAMTAFLAKLP